MAEDGAPAPPAGLSAGGAGALIPQRPIQQTSTTAQLRVTLPSKEAEDATRSEVVLDETESSATELADHWSDHAPTLQLDRLTRGIIQDPSSGEGGFQMQGCVPEVDVGRRGRVP